MKFLIVSMVCVLGWTRLSAADSTLLFFFAKNDIGGASFTEADKLRREYVYRESDVRCETYVVGIAPTEAERLVHRFSKKMAATGIDAARLGGLSVKRLPWVLVVDKKSQRRFSGPFDRDEARRQTNLYLESPVVFCPVDKMWLAPDGQTPSALHNGVTYYFCTDRTVDGLPMKAVFLENPQRYIQESRDYLEMIVAKVKQDEDKQ